VILFKHGFKLDTDQLKLKGVDLHGMGLAVVISIFSLVGFESATTLGGEAKNPMRNVPRAVVWSLIITGAFMVFMSYVEVFGAGQTGHDLGSLTTPLNTLADAYAVPAFKVPVSLGAMVSFFSLTLSCLNAGARLIFPMGGHGFLSRHMHAVHAKNLTPHRALGVYGALMMVVAFILHAVGTSPGTIFGDAGTLAAFGFLTAYYLITFAAPAYLRKLGELRARNIAIAIAASVLLLVPLIGSFYPAPPYPVNLFPYIFLGYMLVGGTWLYLINRRQPGTLAAIESDLERALEESVHTAYAEEEARALGRAGAPGAVPSLAGAGMVTATSPE